MPVAADYWPWWAGSLALATITVGHLWVTGALAGVSGLWARLLNRRREKQMLDAEQAFADDAAFEAALVAATAEEFGVIAATEPTPQPTKQDPAPVSRLHRLPWATSATFLLSITGGSLVASLLTGNFHVQFGLGRDYERLVASGPTGWAVLLGGGVLVGFGTQMAGGCSFGHGLSGCSRLRPGSILATAAFFGSAVGLSLLLDGRLR